MILGVQPLTSHARWFELNTTQVSALTPGTESWGSVLRSPSSSFHAICLLMQLPEQLHARSTYLAFMLIHCVMAHKKVCEHKLFQEARRGLASKLVSLYEDLRQRPTLCQGFGCSPNGTWLKTYGGENRSKEHIEGISFLRKFDGADLITRSGTV